MLVAGNNLSACVGPAVGSRIVTFRYGVVLGAIGFSAGLILQGSTMVNSVSSLLPNSSQTLRAYALTVAIIVFLIAYRIRVPMSLNMSIVGLLAGLSIAQSSPLDILYVGETILTWVVVPLAAFVLAFGILRFFNRGWPSNFWRRLQAYKFLLLVFSFSTAYVTGANTIGMIVATGGFDLLTIIVAIAATFFGCFLLSKGPIKRISEEFFLMRYANATSTLLASTLLMEIATFLFIPLSITQTTTVAVLGVGMSYRTKFVSTKPFLKVATGWIIAPLLSFAIGVLIG